MNRNYPTIEVIEYIKKVIMEDVHPGDVDAISILASLLKELNILFANENQYVGNDTPTTEDSRIALLKQLILKWKNGKETVYR